MRIVLHPEASAELNAAAQWYEEKKIGLGQEFLNETAEAFSRIVAAAESFALWPGAKRLTVRRMVLRRFPYAVAFERYPQHILVLAVAHSKRRPLYWISRTKRPTP